ncbi:uncharacterized protein [Dermacentor andersoni]|uniref:uncharacterized protein isoform X2 n=1 Tax=Dermacentor andersoni TaxID=34620 RepID=UPI003B3A5EBF
MEQFKVCGIFAGLAICALTALGSWSRPALELKGRRWPIFQMVPENGRRITRTCRYIARGRLKEIRNKPDGTHCNKSPFVSEGVCFHGLCVGSYTEVSATELAQNKSTETQEIPVKCSEYKRNDTFTALSPHNRYTIKNCQQSCFLQCNGKFPPVYVGSKQ